MPVLRMCKDCGRSIVVFNTAQTRCPNCQLARSKAKPRKPLPRSTKPIRKVGKETLKYNTWRDTIAIPYLTKRFGYKCFNCGRDDVKLDVDHIKTRGARHDLKFDVKNVRFACRDCHRKLTDGKL
jgi:DNA-directed RNA polymerase subunit RPC12/RpoP